MGLHPEGFIIRRIFASEIWGAYFREGLLSEFYGISIANIFLRVTLLFCDPRAWPFPSDRDLQNFRLSLVKTSRPDT